MTLKPLDPFLLFKAPKHLDHIQNCTDPVWWDRAGPGGRSGLREMLNTGWNPEPRAYRYPEDPKSLRPHKSFIRWVEARRRRSRWLVSGGWGINAQPFGLCHSCSDYPPDKRPKGVKPPKTGQSDPWKTAGPFQQIT